MNRRRKDVKEYCKKNSNEYCDFNDFFKREKDYFLNQLKKRHQIEKDKEIDLSNYPLTEGYLKAYMTRYYAPFITPKLKKDRNNRMDAEQLFFLKFIDGMVTEDTQFMKTAFDLLCNNENKRLFNVVEFLYFID